MWKTILLLSIFLIGTFAQDSSYSSTAPPPPPPSTESQNPPNPPPQQGVKDYTAGGHYYGSGSGHRRSGGHDYGHRVYRGYDAPLIDDYICDLDATILVVTNSDSTHGQANDNTYGGQAQDSGYGASNDKSYPRSKRNAYGPSEYGPARDSYSQQEYGSSPYGQSRDYAPPPRYNDYGAARDNYAPMAHDYGSRRDYGYDRESSYVPPSANADRLRCSVIASNDESACQTCCQLSARRDRSISKDRIIGFLVDNNQINYDVQPSGNDEGYAARKKRSGGYENAAPPATYQQPAALTPEGDYRCVCCAPKRYRPFFDFSRHHHHRHHHGSGGYGSPY